MKILKCLLVLVVFCSGYFAETICNMKNDAGGFTYIYSDENGKELATARMDTPKLAPGADTAAAMNIFSTPNFGMFPKLTSGAIPDGEVKVYNDGKVTMTENFQNGQRNGKSMVYSPAGNVIVEMNYAADLLDGKMVTFKPDGTPLMEMTFDKGIMAGMTGTIPGQDKPFSMSAEDIKKLAKSLPDMRKKMKESGMYKGKKIAILSGEKGSTENGVLKNVFEGLGGEVKIYGENADEENGLPAFADAALKDYELVILTKDCGEFKEDKKIVEKIKELVKDKIMLVCLGESVLLPAKAGVLKDIKVAAYSGSELETALSDAGAIIEDKQVVKTDGIVTAVKSDLVSLKDLFPVIMKSGK